MLAYRQDELAIVQLTYIMYLCSGLYLDGFRFCCCIAFRFLHVDTGVRCTQFVSLGSVGVVDRFKKGGQEQPEEMTEYDACQYNYTWNRIMLLIIFNPLK